MRAIIDDGDGRYISFMIAGPHLWRVVSGRDTIQHALRTTAKSRADTARGRDPR